MSRFAFAALILLAVSLGCTSQAEQDTHVGMINPMVAGGIFDDLFGSETHSERASLSDREKAQRFAETHLAMTFSDLLECLRTIATQRHEWVIQNY